MLIEFAGAAALAGALAGLSLRSGLSGPGHPVFGEIVLGGIFLSIAVNYIPLLVYAIVLIRAGTARQEVAPELEQSHDSRRRYGIQQFLLMVPCAVLVLAVAQALTHRARGGAL